MVGYLAGCSDRDHQVPRNNKVYRLHRPLSQEEVLSTQEEA